MKKVNLNVEFFLDGEKIFDICLCGTSIKQGNF